MYVIRVKYGDYQLISIKQRFVSSPCVEYYSDLAHEFISSCKINTL